MCCITPNTTQAIYFEVVEETTPGSRGLIQFVTKYQHVSGEHRLRVTTVTRNVAQDADAEIKASFDQDAAAVLMARMAVFQVEQDEEGIDVLKWLHSSLVRPCQHIASYRKDDPQSFTLRDQISLYPQYMFHL